MTLKVPAVYNYQIGLENDGLFSCLISNPTTHPSPPKNKIIKENKCNHMQPTVSVLLGDRKHCAIHIFFRAVFCSISFWNISLSIFTDFYGIFIWAVILSVSKHYFLFSELPFYGVLFALCI